MKSSTINSSLFFRYIFYLVSFQVPDFHALLTVSKYIYTDLLKYVLPYCASPLAIPILCHSLLGDEPITIVRTVPCFKL